MQESTRSILKMLMAAVLISTSAVWVKVAQVSPSTSAFYRMLIAGLVLMALCGFHRLKIWQSWRYLFKLFIVALFFAFDLYLWHRSIIYVGPGLATVLGNFQVFFMAFFGFIFLNEKIGWNFITGLIITFTGLFLLVGINWSELSEQYQIGVLFGILTAVAYTGFMLTMRQVQAQESSLTARANLGIMSLLCALIMWVQLTLDGQSIAIPDLQSAVVLLILGVLCQVVGWLLITKTMPLLPTSIVGVLLLLQPALSMLWDVLFFARPMNQYDIAGFIMVLIGVYLATLRKP